MVSRLHTHVSLKIKGNDIQHGKGYWNLNNSHLKSEGFTQEVRSIINKTVNDSFDSYGGLWDTIKYKIKDYAIYFGKKTKRARNLEKAQLEEKISRLQTLMTEDEEPEAFTELADAQTRLDNIVKEELEGVITRAKAQWVEQGERSTKYFFGLEKSKAKKKSIVKLVDEDSQQTILTQSGITDHIVNFYQKVYDADNTTDRTQVDTFIQDCNLDKLPESMTEALEQQITMDELEPIVSKLSNNKSPGWDGLTAEFYKHFWGDIKQLVYSSYLESIENVSMTPSQRIGVLTLIPKPKPPPDLVYIKNWRPITLLNVDYKIFTHAVKNRIIETLPNLISQAQTGFQAGKSTQDNLILMSLVLEHFENDSEDDGILLQVDFQRAFDSVEHHFLFKVMENMGFGSYILRLVKTAFTGCMSFININGHLSPAIYLCRGLHQGSPLSPVLFLLVAQVFSRRLQMNDGIRGLNINGIDILLSLYADDTDIFLNATFHCLEVVLVELQTFGLMSGCKVNFDKTICIPLGRAKTNQQLTNAITAKYGRNFLSDDFTALGIKFNNKSTGREIAEQNYSSKLMKALENLNLWKARDLTIYGRVTLIKSTIMSQFVYLIVPLIRPQQSTCKKIERLVFNYLWEGKPDKIKRDTAVQKKKDGGLDMIHPINFIDSLKLKLINRILDESFSHPWKNILRQQLRYPDHPTISIENNLFQKNCNFASDVGKCYVDWKSNSGLLKSKCIDHCIWQNDLFKDLSKNLWHEKLIRYNILYLSEFINDEGQGMTYNEFCAARLGGARHVVKPKDYGEIRLSLRRFSNVSNPIKNFSNIDIDLKIEFFEPGTATRKLQARKIRDKVTLMNPAAEIPAFKAWCRDLSLESINWDSIRHIYKQLQDYSISIQAFT